MRNMLALLGLILVLFFGIGFFRGWYTLGFSTSTDGSMWHITIGIFRQKVGGDIDDSRKWAGDKIDQIKSTNVAAPSTNPMPGATPTPGTNPTPSANLPGPIGFGKN
jgi:hypothetical protein